MIRMEDLNGLNVDFAHLKFCLNRTFGSSSDPRTKSGRDQRIRSFRHAALAAAHAAYATYPTYTRSTTLWICAIHGSVGAISTHAHDTSVCGPTHTDATTSSSDHLLSSHCWSSVGSNQHSAAADEYFETKRKGQRNREGKRKRKRQRSQEDKEKEAVFHEQ